MYLTGNPQPMQVRSGYYRRFIEGLSKLAKPMIALLEKSAKFI